MKPNYKILAHSCIVEGNAQRTTRRRHHTAQYINHERSGSGSGSGSGNSQPAGGINPAHPWLATGCDHHHDSALQTRSPLRVTSLFGTASVRYTNPGPTKGIEDIHRGSSSDGEPFELVAGSQSIVTTNDRRRRSFQSGQVQFIEASRITVSLHR